MIPDSVYIGYISDGNVRVEFASNLANVTAYSLANHIPLLGALPRISGPRIASARNGLARSFLGTQAEWLLMIDTDMTFRADVVERFLKVADRKKAPIVGGLCFGKGSEGLFPTIYHWNGTLFTRQEGWDENSMVACDGTGAAALFVHRSVFEKIAEHFEEPWTWFQEQTMNGSEVGEDMTFCLRARSLDFPLFVHTGIKFGHVKEFEVDDQFYLDWCKSHRLIVTGTGRCGTGFISRVLQHVKIPADHERFFNPHHHELSDWGRADVSWMAAPFLDSHQSAHIVQLVRDPLATINSLVGIEFFDETSDHKHDEFRQFALDHCPEAFEPDNPIERAMAFYVRWNEMIEPFATQRIRIEDQATPENLKPLTVAAGAVTPERNLALALEKIPSDTNTRIRAELTWDDLQGVWREPLLQMAKRYGYDV